MVSQLLPYSELDDAGRVAYFNRRERRKNSQNPTFELARTHTLKEAENPILEAGFPLAVQNRPITFSVRLAHTGAAPNGLIFEIGSTANGVAAYVEGKHIYFAAGGGILISASCFPPDITVDLVFALIPGSGEARMWVDGHMAARQDFTDIGTWTDGGDGAVATFSGTVLGSVPAPQAVPLTDAEVQSPLYAYVGQVPRQFNDSIYVLYQ